MQVDCKGQPSGQGQLKTIAAWMKEEKLVPARWSSTTECSSRRATMLASASPLPQLETPPLAATESQALQMAEPAAEKPPAAAPAAVGSTSPRLLAGTPEQPRVAAGTKDPQVSDKPAQVQHPAGAWPVCC
jgi:hypothetical protein